MTDTARRGLARIRDTDGMGLVLLPARHYEVLEAVSRWYDRLDVVERARAKPAAERASADFGDLTWLRHLDDDDLAQFLQEVRAAVSVAYHDDDLSELEQLVRDWRATADELADQARREQHVQHRQTGRIAQEQFDTALFHLPWRPAVAGDPLPDHEIARLARKLPCGNKRDRRVTSGWYEPPNNVHGHQQDRGATRRP